METGQYDTPVLGWPIPTDKDKQKAGMIGGPEGLRFFLPNAAPKLPSKALRRDGLFARCAKAIF